MSPGYCWRISEGGLAAKLGLQPMDVIQTYAGSEATSENIKDLILANSKNVDVPIQLLRDGKKLSLSVSEASELGILYASGNPEEAWGKVGLHTPESVREFQDELLTGISRHGARIRGATIAEDSTTSKYAIWSRGRSYQLFRSLLTDELWTEIQGCSRVYVSLPAELSGLPLETLIVEPPDLRRSRLTRWIDVGPPIVYLPAGRLNSASETHEDDGQNAEFEFVGLGGADFSEFDNMPKLPGTVKEVNASAEFIGSRRSLKLLGDKANEKDLRSAASSARFLLVGTHGVPAHGEDVLESALLMTPTSDSDGRLTLFELLSEWPGALRHTETTILSACQSNRGLLLHDENSLGLPFGFLVAGSKAVIASQWPVDDEATSILFAEFFRQIRDGKDSLEALTLARRALRADDRFADPYYWAPFIYISETATATP